MYKVLLEKGHWISDSENGTTNFESFAKSFPDMKSAATALEKSRKFRPYKKAEILDEFL